VLYHMSPFQDHVLVSQDHMGESSSSQFGCNLALGSGRVDLELSCVIPS